MSDKITRLTLALPAVDPVDGKVRSVWILEDKLSRATDFGVVTTIELQRHVPTIIRYPRAVFENPQSGALLYVGQPDAMYDIGGEPINYWHGNPTDVFIVIVDGNKFVRDWTWTKSETSRHWHPMGWTTEFSLQVL